MNSCYYLVPTLPHIIMLARPGYNKITPQKKTSLSKSDGVEPLNKRTQQSEVPNTKIIDAL